MAKGNEEMHKILQEGFVSTFQRVKFLVEKHYHADFGNLVTFFAGGIET